MALEVPFLLQLRRERQRELWHEQQGQLAEAAHHWPHCPGIAERTEALGKALARAAAAGGCESSAEELLRPDSLAAMLQDTTGWRALRRLGVRVSEGGGAAAAGGGHAAKRVKKGLSGEGCAAV